MMKISCALAIAFAVALCCISFPGSSAATENGRPRSTVRADLDSGPLRPNRKSGHLTGFRSDGSIPKPHPRSEFPQTPLDDYVNLPDATYEWHELPEYRMVFDEWVGFVLNMTSQTWLTAADTDQSVWWHFVIVIVPHNLKYRDTAFMWITGNDNGDPVESPTGQDVLMTAGIAVNSASVAATVFQIPNEPQHFAADPNHPRRTEDGIIAFTWAHFINDTSKPFWLLRCPMTKAVVRAMDAVTEFTHQSSAGSIALDQFVVSGASKRGWTTWTTGAVDSRVVAIVPMVMDLLNIVDNLHHYFRALGGWSFAFDDYYHQNITQDLDTEGMKQLTAIVDPFSYRERYTFPKYIISATGDEFFMPDNSHWYYRDLIGETHFRLVENAEHALIGHVSTIMLNTQAFYSSILLDVSAQSPQRRQNASFSPARPQFSWTIDNSTGAITALVGADGWTPASAKMWHATTLDGKRRDFRFLTLGPDGKPFPHPVFWVSEELKPTQAGVIVNGVATDVYVAKMDVPAVGWRGFFIEFQFAGPNEDTMTFTTQISIIPNTFPYPDCHLEGCRGTLV